MPLTLLDGLLNVERADHAVFSGRDRQVDEWGGALGSGQLAARREAFFAFGAPCGGALRIAAEAAVLDDLDVWQQGRQRACRRGFGGAALAADQHAANARIHSIKDQGALHALLADDSSKWVNGWHLFSE